MKSLFEMSNPNTPLFTRNIMAAARSGLPMLQPGCHADAPGAIICGTGPTLTERKSIKKIRKLVRKGWLVIAVKEAITLLKSHGIRTDYSVTIDPDARQIYKTPIDPSVTYCVATSCSPRIFEHLQGQKILLFHSSCGADNEWDLYRTLFPVHEIAQGGYTVVNRAYAVAGLMGIKRRTIAGSPFGWRKGEAYYAKGVKGKPGNPGPGFRDHGRIDGQEWFSKLDLMASARHIAREIRAGHCTTIGDSMAKSLSKYDDNFLDRVAVPFKIEQPVPAKFEIVKAFVEDDGAIIYVTDDTPMTHALPLPVLGIDSSGDVAFNPAALGVASKEAMSHA